MRVSISPYVAVICSECAPVCFLMQHFSLPTHFVVALIACWVLMNGYVEGLAAALRTFNCSYVSEHKLCHRNVSQAETLPTAPPHRRRTVLAVYRHGGVM
ncbi:hypothetical protein TRVL_08563 [Trypanosoma vivax]|nr:hypothetical protein TRVL_08563 [Trypanosoma vivax]